VEARSSRASKDRVSKGCLARKRLVWLNSKNFLETISKYRESYFWFFCD